MGMNQRVRIVVSAVALGLCVATGAATGAGAAAWSPVVSPLPGTSSAAVAVNARGDVALGGGTATAGVAFSQRPAGGVFEAPVTLGTGSANQIAVAINASGDVALGWNTGTQVRLAVRRAGGTFAAIQDFPTTAGPIDCVHVAIDDAGNVVLAWCQRPGTISQIATVVRAPDGTLGPTVATGAGQNAGSQYDLAMNGHGDAVVVATHSNGTNYLAEAATREPGATSFSAFAPVSAASQDAGAPSADVDAAGHEAIAWQRSDGANQRIQVAYRSPGGLFSQPTEASPAFVTATYPGVAVSDSGEVAAFWTGPGSLATVRTAAFGAAFTAPTTTLPTGGARGDVAMAPNGAVVAAWGANTGGTNNLYASTRAPGGSFATPLVVGPVTTLYGNVDTTPVDMDDAGDAVAGFPQATATGIGFGVLDVSPPELRSIGVPGSATAGAAVGGFSVATFDTFSTVGAPHWDFGDGAGADGASVSHTYNNAGTYTVKVTATDAAGNATSATRSIAVGAAAGAPPTTQPPTFAPPPVRAPVKCKVPKLAGLTYERAKARLISAHCKVGKTKKPKGHKTTRNLVVKTQSRRAGTSTTSGARVDITMKVKPKSKKKAKH